MSSSRDKILAKLRAAQQPFTDVPPITVRHRMVPLADTSPEALLARFKQEAEKLGCYVYSLPEAETLVKILELIGSEKSVLSWEFDEISLSGLRETLDRAKISVAKFNDGKVKVGITGADWGLAATGSIVVSTGKGKFRTTSLLPDVHIVALKADRIRADFETWIAGQRSGQLDAFRTSSNTVIITGPSKTADIAQELIKGAHGPRVVHIFILQ